MIKIKKWVWLWLIALTGFVSFTLAEEEKPRGEMEKWEWTDAEIKKIEIIEKKIKPDAKGFYVYDTREYTVRSDISARFAAELAQYMEIFVTIWPKLFMTPPKGHVECKLTITVFATKAEYRNVNQYRDVKNIGPIKDVPEWSGGFFYPSWRVANGGKPQFDFYTFPWGKEGKDVSFCKDFNRGVLQHEGTHMMLERFVGIFDTPVFFSEGCATYFEFWNLRISRPTKTERKARFVRSFHLQALTKKYQSDPEYKPSLAELIHMTHEKWNSGKDNEISLRYALAESFTDFLLSSESGRIKFRQIIQRLYEYRWERRLIRRHFGR